MKAPHSLLALFSSLVTLVSADTWTIPTLSTHFMGKNSGLPGGQWPENFKFNVSVDFTLKRVSRADASPFTTKCGCNWTDSLPRSDPTKGQSPFPKGVWQACDKGGIAWRIRDEAGMTAANFSIELLVPEIDGVAMVTDKHTNLGLSYATAHISSNNASDPNSCLTCIGGAPLTGIHCSYEVDNVVLGIGGPITLNMSARQDTTTPPFNVTNLSDKIQASSSKPFVPQSESCNGTDSFSFDLSCDSAKGFFTCTGNPCSDAKSPGLCSSDACPGENAKFYWTDTTVNGSHWTSTLNLVKEHEQVLNITDLDGKSVVAPMLISGSLDVTDADLSTDCKATSGSTCVAGSSKDAVSVVPVFHYFVALGDIPYPWIAPTTY